MWVVSAPNGASHTITASDDGTNVVVTIDGTTQTKAASSVASLSVIGGAGDDSFTFDASLASAGIPVSFDGGAGTDTLNGPAPDSTWAITGVGSGTVGSLSFSGFENLTGAANNKDSFDFSESGALSGVVDGGPGGYDVIEVHGGSDVVSTITGPQSGTIARDGNVVTYAGMEPATIDGSTTHTITINLGDSAVDNGNTVTSVTVADSGT